ncbi:MAG: FeoB-associated Cys-rich membrane protein [Clostridia bacterium]|nr:FeoB-associated Cys-rich membrane protein [Clostridia bacterium]
MNAASYIILALVIIWAASAIIHEIKNKGCCGDCKTCRGCKRKRRKNS